MNLRIIAGAYGGRVIDAPDRRSTHAMSERGRNALFNSIAGQIQGMKVLDAFAGSGSLGIEAISRGAESVSFIEKDRIAAKIIQKNVDLLGIKSSKVIKATVSNWLDTSSDNMFDVIFADPPYHDIQLATVSRLFTVLKPGGLFILSHPSSSSVSDEEGIKVIDTKSYGNLTLTLYRKKM